MQYFDSHAHIHDPEFYADYNAVIPKILSSAKAAGVEHFISVGTSYKSSELAVKFSKKHSIISHAALALHPHEVATYDQARINSDFDKLAKLVDQRLPEVVAIGECGLDYYYHKQQSIRLAQQDLFRKHLDLAIKYDLPLIFHIRQAFADFFAIIDEYNGNNQKINGVVHSFSAHPEELAGCLSRGLYIGLNGIMTFTKDDRQLEAAKAVPIDKLLLETDAPFLTPKPFRGTMCEPKHVVQTAEFLAELRNEPLAKIAETTTKNARDLFRL